MVSATIYFYKPTEENFYTISLSSWCDTENKTVSANIQIDSNTTNQALPCSITFNASSIHIIHMKTLTDSLGHQFIGWDSEVGSNIDLQVTSSGSHVAHFSALIPTSRKLTIMTTTNGHYNISIGIHPYSENTVVHVLAIPDSEYKIDYWLLDGINSFSSQTVATVTMNKDYTLQAIFKSTIVYESTIASTELIDFTSMTDSQVSTFLSYCHNQGIPEITVRLRAMDIGSVTAPPANEVAKVKTIITTATSLGIAINLDMHTWYTTWDYYFDDSATQGLLRTKYINYVKSAINAFNGYSVKTWMVMNEPQAQTASTSENNFILDVINTAKSMTSQPVSVRFMGSASPTTGHYSTAIDTACDFICRNMYWTSGSYYDPRNYNSVAENTMLNALNSAHTAGKECWITEFGGTKSNLESQRSKVEATIVWFNEKGFDRVFCWVCQPVGGSGENYNIFTGMTPNPAFYELVNSV